MAEVKIPAVVSLAESEAYPMPPPSPTTIPDPWQTYVSTRPSDWLKMPAVHSEVPKFAQGAVAAQEIQNNEIYLLMHSPVGLSALIAFTVTCTGQYTVEVGSMVNGYFITNPAYTVQRNSGAKYETEIPGSAFGSVTSDGYAQCVLRVTGQKITRFMPATNSKMPTLNYTYWNVMEISSCASAMITMTTGINLQYWGKLRYFALYGENDITSADMMFNGMPCLLCIMALNTNKALTMRRFFDSCRILRATPSLSTSLVTEANSTFAGNQAILQVDLDMPIATNLVNIVTSCPALVTASIRAPRATDATAAFNACMSLSIITGFSLNAITVPLTNTWNGCRLLSRLTFTGGTWATPQAISLVNCAFMRDGLVEMFGTLPTISSAATLTLAGNPGVADLTDADKAIATSKGWTLVL